MGRMKSPWTLRLLWIFLAVGCGQSPTVGDPSKSIHDDGTEHTGVLRNPLILQPILHDVSAPLRDLHPAPSEAGAPHEASDKLPRVPHSSSFYAAATRADPVAQFAAIAAAMPTASLNIDGVGQGFSGPAGAFTVASAPPDTDGDVGLNHYVQIVNSNFAIFNKTGTPVYGPVPTNTLWQGMAGGCATTNDGDGTVRYDRIADRWVIAQFSVNGGTGPFFQCIAVSTSADPTGTYARYVFQYAAFNDYPKMGLWPDGYYFTYNMFPNNVFAGAQVCAMDRNRMLTGAPATMQCFTTSTSWGGVLASDLDGPQLPPAGSPNYLVSLGTNVLGFWKFHVDWVTPANSTFVGPANITVASFSALCAATGTCVPQTGTTQQLDSLSDRLMNRFAYRNFGDHESLLVSHAVVAGAGGGVRWYELRTPGTTPSVFQQGTYAPDGSYRWLSSLAMDRSGDIGLGFSLSSSALHPEIHYTGRLPGDPAGTMGQGEGTLINGGGSQTGSNLSRWGDYSSMNIDPSDDCTFWYTQEYIAVNGAFNWHTRIGSFKFPGCGATTDTTPPTTSLTAPVAGATVSGTTTVTASASDNVGVTRVEFYVDAVLLSTSTAAPYSASWNTSGATNANHTLSSKAYDAAGNVGSSSPVTVRVNNSIPDTVPPTTAITAPAAGATVSGTVSITGSASDNVGVTRVEFYVDATLLSTSTASPYSASWNTSSATNASHSLTSKAYDAAGNVGSSGAVTVTVSNTSGGSLVNGNFESGSLAGWTSAGTTSISTAAHSGTFAAMVGGTAPTNGDSSLAQTFTAPTGSNSVSFWYNVHCPDTITYDWATATLTDNGTGTTSTVVAKVCSNTNTWVQATASVSAGRSYTLKLVSHDDNYSADPTFVLYDDVVLGTTTTPSGVVNGGFETGSLSGWTAVGSALATTPGHSGTYAARLGSTVATNGDSSLSQTFTAPAATTALSFWYSVQCPDTVTYDWATATLKDNTTAVTTTVLARTCSSTGAWTQVNAAVTAGHSYTLTLTSHDDNFSGDPTYTSYDDVTVH